MASNCEAKLKLNLNAIPLLPSVEALVLNNIKSSLNFQNRKVFEKMEWPDVILQQSRFNLLFDPQTSG